jgi:hypothetical protein
VKWFSGELILARRNACGEVSGSECDEVCCKLEEIIPIGKHPQKRHHYTSRTAVKLAVLDLF